MERGEQVGLNRKREASKDAAARAMTIIGNLVVGTSNVCILAFRHERNR